MLGLARFLLLLTCLCAAIGSAVAAPIELTSPMDYQVFQRQSLTRGVIHIAGRFDGMDGSIQYRLLGKPLQGELSDKWETLRVAAPALQMPAMHTFDAEVASPAGGWYRLEVRCVKNGATIAEHAVEHVGVGEVFVVAGQSNSANYGEERQKPASNLVVSGGGPQWSVANDPQPGAGGDRGSFIPSFGDAMVERFHVPVGIVSVGAGGTSVREWLPKGDAVAALPTTNMNVIAVGDKAWASSGQLFDNMIGQMGRLRLASPHEACPNGFRAVLWHQGESDAHQQEDRTITPEQYREYLARVIQRSRELMGWNMPWFIAQVSYHTPADVGMPELRTAQKAVCAEGFACEGPNTDELQSEYREANGQGVHFNARGLQRHGELWAKYVGDWLKTSLEDGPKE